MLKNTIDNAVSSDLIQAAFEGDREAFGQVVTAYQQPVYSLCWRFMKNSDAEDLAQETFVRAFVHRSRFAPDRAVLPWLLTIARRLCIDKLRRRKNEPAIKDEYADIPDSGNMADRAVMVKQELSIVNNVLDTMPEGHREAVVLHLMEGLSYKDIAEVLDVPVGTVMTWMHRGRQFLKDAVASPNQPKGTIRGGSNDG